MFSNMVNVGFKVDQYPHKGQKKRNAFAGNHEWDFF